MSRNDTGRLAAVFVQTQPHAEPREITNTVRVTDGGIDGDYRTREGKPKRVVLLVGMQCLQNLGVPPGFMREQLLIDHVDPDQVPLGSRILVGNAQLSLVERCEPCVSLVKRMDTDHPKTTLAGLFGRRGTFARVDVPGHVKTGDPVQVLGVATEST